MTAPKNDPNEAGGSEHDARQRRRERRLRRLVPALLGLVVVVFGWPSLELYNVTWDEALGDFFFGERYLYFFTTWDESYLDFAGDPFPSDHQPDLGRSPFRGRPWEYYPVANVLAAATSKVFSGWLGWLDPYDGFHALNLLLALVLIAGFFPFLADRFGLVAATAGLVLLFTSPRVFVHMMANIKDFPEMVFFSLTCVVFLRGWDGGSVGDLLAAGALAGLALGTKANAVFLAPILLATMALGGLPAAWRGRMKQLVPALVGSATLAAGLLLVSWPYLWGDPLGRLARHYHYLAGRHAVMNEASFAPVLEAVFLTTPPVLLLFFVVGLVPCVRQALRRDRAAILLLSWIAVVLGRYLMPQAVNFDGVRHFLELFPAMAAVAGAGVAWLGKGLANALAARSADLSPRRLRAAFLLLVLVPGTRAVLATHPFQIAYWNTFAGGFRGAWERQLPQACDYWGTSYRLGMEWLNENAPPGALLVVPVMEHTVRLVAPERLRDDILLLPVTTPLSPRIDPERLRLTREAALSRPVYAMFVDRRDWLNQIMVDCLRHLEPEVTWDLDGAPVLWIYRYRPPLQGP